MKKKRKVFNLYNFVVIMCLLVIGGSLYVIMNKENNSEIGLKEKFDNIIASVGEAISGLTGGKEEKDAKTTNAEEKQSDEGKTNTNLNTNVNTSTDANTNQDTKPKQDLNADANDIGEARAKEIAVEEFIKLGEEGIVADNLSLRGILRGGEKYYEVSSANNSVEIKMEDGKVARINNKEV